MVDKATRKRFGVSGQPLPATRVFGRKLDHSFSGLQEAWSLWVVDEEAGTLTQANLYGTLDTGYLGKGFDPSNYRQPFQGWESEKVKAIRKSHEELQVAQVGILAPRTPAKAKQQKTAAKS